ncbi:hypothetical protein [Streptosporangium roseum]|uniref:Uncharacterized protein n=1 Tax=Streptosporangium roseum (strain ATCC 12428 / DSM 43021 / JCM 3005 / KCTC 9067 / NCIMB 10171 / NRRL 2505 / NI 9100) TaxID=479432 RepID=D2BAX8_STRRD|nr:hypothetical protein [Streptosporangium roseum]ACZ91742.1 hypothetical protein Sros_9119 [Streptosporangium roseum DSM 43021]
MTNPGAPVLDRHLTIGCGCFVDALPLPMGCAVCGHAPYAYGCPGRAADHEYAQPSGTLMATRLEARRTGTRHLPAFESPATVAPAETIPLVPARPRPEQAPIITPAVPAPVPRRVLRPVRRPACMPRPAVVSWRGGGRRPMPCGARGVGAASRPRPFLSYGGLQTLLPHPTKRTYPAFATIGRVLDRLEVRSMEDAGSTTPEPAIPGWRVICSDAGRYWASREKPFPGKTSWGRPPFRTVDADTFDDLRVEVERQESAAQEAAGQVAS